MTGADPVALPTGGTSGIGQAVAAPSFAVELAPRRIRVNAVSPGPVAAVV